MLVDMDLGTQHEPPGDRRQIAGSGFTGDKRSIVMRKTHRVWLALGLAAGIGACNLDAGDASNGTTTRGGGSTTAALSSPGTAPAVSTGTEPPIRFVVTHHENERGSRVTVGRGM
jgi:hypothetical protein